MAAVRNRPRPSLWVLLLVVVVLSASAYRVTREPWPAQQGIAVPPGEDALTARVIAAAVAAVDAAHVDGRPWSRQAFAKAHGCVRATVAIPPLEPRLRHGLFAQQAQYPAWIRFSSGGAHVRSDQMRAARALALKVMGVPGPSLLADDGGTQDFVLADSPRFFVPDVASYALYADALAHGENGYFFGDGSWNPARWRLRELYLATRGRRTPPASLLQTQYYSQTPYRLGPEQFVKYSARPCEWKRPPRQDRTDDMLRRSLKEELSLGDACFELLVQSQAPGKNMPVEDATVLWSESDSPFVPVARVTLPKQVFDTVEQDRFCEALSFTPWHAGPEQEPVGGINRLRRAVYREISRYRHARSQTPRAEPRGWCLDLSGAECPGEQQAPPSPASPAASAPTSPAAPPSSAATPPTTKPRPTPTTPTPTPETPAESGGEPPAAEPTPTPTPPPR
jgi:hypothetical protein